MRVLIIGINYEPEVISTAIYTTGLAETLAAGGHRVDVVTAKPYYPEWKIAADWRNPWWNWRKTSTGVQVTHCPLYVPSTPTGARRIAHHISFALAALPVAIWNALTNRPDVVFVVAPSMVSAPVGLLASVLGGAKSWLHIQDFEVEAAFSTKLLSENSRIGRLAKAYERWVLARFDRISTISYAMMAKLSEKSVPHNKAYHLRNWANLSRIKVLTSPSPLKAALGITTPYVALYSGNLANKQGLDIIPAMARVLRARHDLSFVICGDGPMRDTLIEQTAGLDNVRFVPLQPIEQLSDLLGMADVHLLPQIAATADLVLPSKLANMLASGRPILATAGPKTALGQEVEGAGVLVTPGDAQAAAAALEALLDDAHQRQSLGQEARNRAVTRWDMMSVLKSLEQSLRGLARSKA